MPGMYCVPAWHKYSGIFINHAPLLSQHALDHEHAKQPTRLLAPPPLFQPFDDSVGHVRPASPLMGGRADQIIEFIKIGQQVVEKFRWISRQRDTQRWTGKFSTWKK